MYRWRKLTPAQQEETLANRKRLQRPWHSPKHSKATNGTFLITATCFDHQPVIGYTADRMDEFTSELLDVIAAHSLRIDAWVVLPNHYHALVWTTAISNLLRDLGRLHGRTSHQWNGEDLKRGRQVWFNFPDRSVSTEDQHFRSIQYVHHNPVKHGLVSRWTDWKWSSAGEYLDSVGRDEATRLWKEYPISGFR